jgi:ATP-dependent DNA helicase RecG
VPHRYRNPFLVQAMTELNMIDRMGYGIHDIFRKQAQRYLPMPDYDLHTRNTVSLTVYGSVIDRVYTVLLMEHTGIPLGDILALDRVQKGLPLSDDAIARLRKAKLIEGRC